MDDILDKYINRHSPGYVIETYYDGKYDSYTYGNSRVLPDSEEVQEDTLYDIASLTKMFTSTLTYIAYEEGKVDIYKNVYDINNKFINLRDVRLLDLLSHRVELWTDGYLGDSKTKEEFLNKLYTASVKNYLPTYVDSHYIIIGVLLEEIYGKDLNVLFKEKIFDKLGMNNTTYYPKGSIASCNFENQKEGIVININEGVIHDTKGRVGLSLGIHTGHAGIFTTAKDFMKFCVSFLEHTLLDSKTIELMLDHEDVNKENFDRLKEVVEYNENIDVMYHEALEKNIDVHISRPINNMGARYRNAITCKTDVPFNASENSIAFSGYSGPIFTIDFDKKIIIVMMCNVVHNSYLDRVERKALTDDIINEIFDRMIKASD